MNVVVSRAFHVRECPLSELPLYKITWSLGDTKFSSRVLKIFTRPLRSLMKKNFLSPLGYVICAVFFTVNAALQCCNHSKQCRNNVTTLCCAENRHCESSHVTSPLAVKHLETVEESMLHSRSN